MKKKEITTQKVNQLVTQKKDQSILQKTNQSIPQKKESSTYQKKVKKEAKNIKEYLPLNILNIRKNNPLKIPGNLPARNFTNNLSLEPIKLFPEWPNENELNVKNKN